MTDSPTRPRPHAQPQPIDTSDTTDGLAGTINKTRLAVSRDGPELTDQYGRPAAACRAACARARVHARRLLEARADLESAGVVFGRSGTEKKAKQLGLLAGVFEAAADRDARFAAELEELA